MDYLGINKLAQSGEIAWSVALAVVGIMVITVNSITLFTFRKSMHFRSRKHIMVINLAVVDLMYGTAGIPLTVVFLLKPTSVSFYIYQGFVTFTKMASLFTFGAIAVERMHAIVWPIRHQVVPNGVYRAALVLIWVLAAFVTTFSLLQWSGYISLIFSETGPLIIVFVMITVLVCYMSIWICVHRRKRRHPNFGAQVKKDKTLALTLLMVAGTFAATWCIPMIYLFISRTCKTCYQPSIAQRGCIHLIFAAQSILNPVIYCFRLPLFKESLKENISCWRANIRRRRVTSFTLRREIAKDTIVSVKSNTEEK